MPIPWIDFLNNLQSSYQFISLLSSIIYHLKASWQKPSQLLPFTISLGLNVTDFQVTSVNTENSTIRFVKKPERLLRHQLLFGKLIRMIIQVKQQTHTMPEAIFETFKNPIVPSAPFLLSRGRERVHLLNLGTDGLKKAT